MAALVYLVTTVAIVVALWRRYAVSPAACAVLVTLPLVFTARAFFTRAVYAPIDLAYLSQPLASISRAVNVTRVRNPLPSDVTAQFIPWNAALRWAVAHREWPLWNPFELCGNVLAAAAQSAPYHPVTLLSLLLPAPDAFAFIASMTYFLAALGAFLYLRAIHLDELPALFGAAGWSYSMYVVTFILTAHGAAVALLPLVLLGAHLVVEQRGEHSAMAFGLAIILLTLCGHPETLLHLGALAVVYAAVHSGRKIVTVLATIALVAMGAALLTAIFWAPMIEAIPQTVEYRNRAAVRPAEQHAASWPVVLHLLRNDFVPFPEALIGVEVAQHPPSLRHHLANTAYAGALLVGPAAYALWRARNRMTRFFAALIAFGLLAGAEAPGVTNLLAHVPLVNLSITARMLSFASFGLCALAAIGLQQWLRDSGPLDLVCLASAAVFAVIALTALRDGLSPDFVRVNIARQVIPLLLAFACVRVLQARTAATVLLLLLLLQRTVESRRFIPTINRRAFYPRIAAFDLIPRTGEPFRIVGQDYVFTPGTATLYGLEDVRGYQAMTFARLVDTFPLWCLPQPVWFNRVDDLSLPFLSLMNVRFALTPDDAVLPFGWRRRGAYPGYQILENTRALPRAFIPPVVHVGARPDTTLHQMASCRDFGHEAWIETPDAPATLRNGPGRVATIARGSRLLLRVHMDGDGWIVVSETGWRGWQAWRGSEQLNIRFADHTFVAFYLPRGQHEVTMFYRPRAFVYGATLSGVSVLLLIAGATARRYFRPRRATSELVEPNGIEPSTS